MLLSTAPDMDAIVCAAENWLALLLVGGSKRSRVLAASSTRLHPLPLALARRHHVGALDAYPSRAWRKSIRGGRGSSNAVARWPSVEETAELPQVAAQTEMRDWRLARAWLPREFRR